MISLLAGYVCSWLKICECSGVLRRRGSACARQPRAYSDRQIRRRCVYDFSPDSNITESVKRGYSVNKPIKISDLHWRIGKYFIQKGNLWYLNPSCDPLRGLGAFILFILNWGWRMKGRVWNYGLWEKLTCLTTAALRRVRTRWAPTRTTAVATLNPGREDMSSFCCCVYYVYLQFGSRICPTNDDD